MNSSEHSVPRTLLSLFTFRRVLIESKLLSLSVAPHEMCLRSTVTASGPGLRYLPSRSLVQVMVCSEIGYKTLQDEGSPNPPSRSPEPRVSLLLFFTLPGSWSSCVSTATAQSSLRTTSTPSSRHSGITPRSAQTMPAIPSSTTSLPRTRRVGTPKPKTGMNEGDLFFSATFGQPNLKFICNHSVFFYLKIESGHLNLDINDSGKPGRKAKQYVSSHSCVVQKLMKSAHNSDCNPLYRQP